MQNEDDLRGLAKVNGVYASDRYFIHADEYLLVLLSGNPQVGNQYRGGR